MKAQSVTKSRTSGFALVVTVSLMVLLTVVAVGLMGLASISLRQSDSSMMASVAQANARMALMLAIGELQRSTGPDQRVTTTADIAGDSGGVLLEAGKPPQTDLTVLDASKGLGPLRAGTRHWTGVWELNKTAIPDAQRNTLGIYTTTPRPTLLRWLVSGDSIDTPTIRPDSEIAALSAEGKVNDPTKAVVLVGRGTLGTTGTRGVDDFVSAPLVETTGPTGKGRYAWWVGDEGVKAAMNIATTSTDKGYASLTAQRRAWETVEGLDSYPSSGATLAETLPRIASFRQAELLPSMVKPALQRNFHAATVDSRGVIADTLLGGTRIDLSAVLAGNLETTPAKFGTIPNPPVRGTTIIPRTVAATMRAPLWDTLKSFHDRAYRTGDGTLLVTAGANDREPSIAPLICDFRVLMGVRFVSQGREGTTFKINPCGKIAIALANPYPVPMRWEQDLEIQVFSETPPGNRPSRVWGLGGNSVFFPDSNNPAEPAVFNNTFFRIRAGTLGPGEARAYTQAAPFKRDRSNSKIVVDLDSFSSARPFEFSRCIEMDTTGTYTNIPGLDIRESWTTTLMSLEMRLAGGRGSTRALRKVERFELDNGYFGPNTLRVTPQQAGKLNDPVPIMLYSFQISQPGADYTSLMPSGYELGQRASAVRTFADFNLQATMFPKPITSYNPTPFFMESNNSIDQLGGTPPNPPGGDTGKYFTRNLVADPLPWGRSSASGPKRTVLFDVPDRIASIAQLQHADLTGDDRYASLSNQPGNAVGNSYAPVWVRRDLTIQKRPDYEVIGSPNQSGARNEPRNYYDISYLLNAALWDRYFFSNIGSGGLPETPALVPIDDDPDKLRDPLTCASSLMIHGAFNVNSTSKEAWKAFLGSSRLFRHPTAAGSSEGSAFPRTLRQPDAATLPATGTDSDSFSGYRRLSDRELDLLAEEIVKQVRLRGPFLSLSHFVNRALGDCAPNARGRDLATRRMLTRAGALQTAIDEAGVNISIDGRKSGFKSLRADQDRARLTWKENAPRADMDGGDRANQLPNANPSEPDWAVTSTDNNFGAMASIAADRWMLSDPSQTRELGYRSTGIPGWLTQADVLQVIGPSLSTRSDTFRIRAYGEALDATGQVRARAWCEAIVQRQPDYVDPANAAITPPSELNTMNARFGRRYDIVAFRWLAENEI